MPDLFKFKQFDIDQSGCAMKINTDGVLLGALTNADNPKSILDIGAGTGVIALMLAQRFPEAKIDAVEIDQSAAATAGNNFANSPFANRLHLYPDSFEQFFESNPKGKYDLIVSNPPFYINSLISPRKEKQLAKHANGEFFARLVEMISGHLNKAGIFCMISPIDTAVFVSGLTAEQYLHPQAAINIRSFPDSQPHRVMAYFGFKQGVLEERSFVIYRSVGKYAEEYVNLLKPYFIVF